MTLDDLELSTRARTVLTRIGVETVGDLAALPDAKLRATPGVGPRLAREIEDMQQVVQAELGAEVERLTREMSLLSNGARQHMEAADMFEAELRAAEADAAAARDREAKLRTAAETVHSWIVCAAISTPEEMAESFGEMEQILSAALRGDG